jgi:hypothetical protein
MGEAEDQLATGEKYFTAIQLIEPLLAVDNATRTIVLTGDASNLGIEDEVLQQLLSSLDEVNSMIHAGDVQLAEVAARIPIRHKSPRPDAPTITSVRPVQFHLRNPEPHIDVSWSTHDACDKYHFIWTESSHPPKNGGLWGEVELTPGRSFGSSFSIPKTLPLTPYTFKVQGCQSELLGHDNCSPWSEESSIAMPANTHSLRTFLSISGVPLDQGIRFLGAPVVGTGIRAMMRV